MRTFFTLLSKETFCDEPLKIVPHALNRAQTDNTPALCLKCIVKPLSDKTFVLPL